MSKASISSIERRKDGSLLINYWSGGAYQFRIFYYYTKRAALRELRQELGIKRNPSPIRDYTVTPKPSLSASLEAWANLQG